MPENGSRSTAKLGAGSTFSFSITLGHAPQPERRGPGLEVDVSRADEAYDLLDRHPQEALQVMLTY
ncbi:MAG: hypothetical protein LC776_16335 [Acidobacteria bacterium]|nr:hypothetical protein [Acidobacteriota bacterium]